MAAERDQRHPVRQGVVHQVSGGSGHEYLAAVPACSKTRGANDRRPLIVRIAAHGRLTGVNRHAHEEDRSQLVLQGALRGNGGGYGIGGASEGADNRVPLTLFDRSEPAVRLDRLTEQLGVASDRVVHQLGRGFPAARRTLHVGQQERHRPRRHQRRRRTHITAPRQHCRDVAAWNDQQRGPGLRVASSRRLDSSASWQETLLYHPWGTLVLRMRLTQVAHSRVGTMQLVARGMRVGVLPRDLAGVERG